jgi:hypothetical protein
MPLSPSFQEISVGLFRIGVISETIIVGVLGWCSVLWGVATLFQAAFADVLGQIRTIVYVVAVAGAILLSLILARHQMLQLVTFIFKGLLNLASTGPWETTVTPVPR